MGPKVKLKKRYAVWCATILLFVVALVLVRKTQLGSVYGAANGFGVSSALAVFFVCVFLKAFIVPSMYFLFCLMRTYVFSVG